MARVVCEEAKCGLIVHKPPIRMAAEWHAWHGR